MSNFVSDCLLHGDVVFIYGIPSEFPSSFVNDLISDLSALNFLLE